MSHSISQLRVCCLRGGGGGWWGRRRKWRGGGRKEGKGVERESFFGIEGGEKIDVIDKKK